MVGTKREILENLMRLKLLVGSIVFSLSTVVMAADLSVEISNIEHDKGQVRVVLYNNPDSFLNEEKSQAFQESPATVGTLTVNFNHLQPGDYALVAYHDEDGDGKLDRFLGMIPSEGYGLSRNPKVFGKPDFDDARISLRKNDRITIHLNY
jgi:uncharacterized protein (DUF2141 family)